MQVALGLDAPMTLARLKKHLWECAEILRGSAVDRTDWKAYILPLLFFKRLSDVWDEETREAQELYGDVDPVDYPETHRFQIPDGCHLLTSAPRPPTSARRSPTRCARSSAPTPTPYTGSSARPIGAIARS